jgi:molybdopterin synthase sulfur carrier subunit
MEMNDTRITVKVFATLQLKLGVREIAYTGPPVTMEELIAWLQRWAVDHGNETDVTAELLEPDRSIRPGTMLLIDGKNVHHREGLKTPVDGSVVSVFPPSGGG